jgi:hypothetical protein
MRNKTNDPERHTHREVTGRSSAGVARSSWAHMGDKMSDNLLIVRCFRSMSLFTNLAIRKMAIEANK